jgi:hypothetical protein
MAFDKNMVITDSQYKIDFVQTEVQMLDCPRCGHSNPRQPRTVCEHCSHFIPHEEARQDWAGGKKSAAELYGIVDEETKKSKELRLKAGRKNVGWIVQGRRMGLILLTVALAMAGYAFALRTYLGDAGFKQFDERLNSNMKTIAKVVKKAAE